MINLQQTTPIVITFTFWKVVIAWSILLVFFWLIFGGVLKKRTTAEEWENRHAPDMEEK